jgi:hypothetical protein
MRSLIPASQSLSVLTLAFVLLLSAPLTHTIGAEPDKPADVSASPVYDPIERDIEGWTIVIDPQLLADENRAEGEKALKALANHLQRITYIVPEPRLADLKKLRIWVERHNQALGNMQYHPGADWLRKNGHDPRLVKHVHIPRAKQLLDPHMWAKHPYVVLHELAHSYHDQHLGFDHPEVLATYQAARDAGIYDQVLLFSGQKERHYGLNNQMEYFAEATDIRSFERS